MLAPIGDSNRAVPDSSSDVVIREQGFVAAERFPLRVARHSTPELEADHWTPRGLAALQQRVDAIAEARR